MIPFYSNFLWYGGLFMLGGCGVVLRVLTVNMITSLLSHTTAQLWAIGVCNVVGALLGGALWGSPRTMISAFYQTMIAMGLIGGYTTFSAMMVDALILLRAHAWNVVIIYLSTTFVLAIFGAMIGFYVMRSLTAS